MLPEEKAREKIDRQLMKAGWDIVPRDEYIPHSASAVKEALMQGNTESDYLLFVEDKAIAVVEAKREENPLAENVQNQAEGYATHPQPWYGLWYNGLIPLVYLANGNKIYFKKMLVPDSDYVELAEMHSPKKMLQLIQQTSVYGALPRLEKRGLRDCQYRAEMAFEQSIKNGKKKSLAVLATGSGKTYLACLASYRLLNYTPVRRILFLVDRNNLARQTVSEFSQFDRTEGQEEINDYFNPDLNMEALRYNLTIILNKMISYQAVNYSAARVTINPNGEMKMSNRVFIVHGHDDAAKIEMARTLEKAGMEAIILHEQADTGLTIIEKIERYTNVNYAVVLYTECDLGRSKEDPVEKEKYRARQNVVFEHGYLISKLGRDHVSALVKGDVETPGDISGVVYTPMDASGAWKMTLAKNMKAIGMPIDLNTFCG